VSGTVGGSQPLRRPQTCGSDRRLNLKEGASGVPNPASVFCRMRGIEPPIMHARTCIHIIPKEYFSFASLRAQLPAC
jgi:putative hemolysin